MLLLPSPYFFFNKEFPPQNLQKMHTFKGLVSKTQMCITRSVTLLHLLAETINDASHNP